MSDKKQQNPYNDYVISLPMGRYWARRGEGTDKKIDLIRNEEVEAFGYKFKRIQSAQKAA